MRLIDADYVKSKLNKSALGGHLHYYVCGVIDDAPTIKAEPVKHGHWIERVSDLISKQAVREALLKKGQTTKRYKLGETWELNWFEIEDALSSIPTIEAEPIVRCKNCEFVDTLECPMNYIDHQRLIFSNRSPDWFCAEGVKKDET